jgi:hypothetical protein
MVPSPARPPTLARRALVVTRFRASRLLEAWHAIAQRLPGRDLRSLPGRSIPRSSSKVEAIEIHDLVPRDDEILHEGLLRVVARIDLREGS